MRFSTFVITFVLSVLSLSVQAKGEIKSGSLWPDNQGVPINAHGGGVIFYQGKYYWFGEHKAENTSSAMVGVMCYSSKDLSAWKNEGVALAVSEEQGSDIEKGCVLERPKVVYCKKTHKFVMWFHLELKGLGYRAARAGVAVSDSPIGPYTFLYSSRVNAYKYPTDWTTSQMKEAEALKPDDYAEWWTPIWRTAIQKGMFLQRDFETGQMARDQTVFVDDNGKAYHIFSSEDNLTIQIAELSADYTFHTGRFVRVAAGGQNEAPAIFKKDGVYWMITSGCTGWDPNEARMFSATNIMGPWRQYDNPCIGPHAEKTFGGQSTYILKVEGKKDTFIFMADIWRPNHPIDARYIWLPITFRKGLPVVEWRDQWSLNEFQ